MLLVSKTPVWIQGKRRSWLRRKSKRWVHQRHRRTAVHRKQSRRWERVPNGISDYVASPVLLLVVVFVVSSSCAAHVGMENKRNVKRHHNDFVKHTLGSQPLSRETRSVWPALLSAFDGVHAAKSLYMVDVGESTVLQVTEPNCPTRNEFSIREPKLFSFFTRRDGFRDSIIL